MSDGLPTPAAHDGMGVVVQRRIGVGNEIILVRNHELSNSSSASRIIGAGRDNVAKYDTGTTGVNYQIGGNTNLVWRNGEWVDSYASFGGIYRPCAGGASTWGSWLSNEEMRSNTVSSTGKKHGYVFEIPADTSLNAANTVPIVGMGRFAHEASAIDPATGYWYLTEDQGDANTLYRFLPTNASGGLGSLHAGGRLQGLKVKGVTNADLRFPTLCQKFQLRVGRHRQPRPGRRDAGVGGRQRLGQRPLHARPTPRARRSSAPTRAAGSPTASSTSATSAWLATPPARRAPAASGRWTSPPARWRRSSSATTS